MSKYTPKNIYIRLKISVLFLVFGLNSSCNLGFSMIPVMLNSLVSEESKNSENLASDGI